MFHTFQRAEPKPEPERLRAYENQPPLPENPEMKAIEMKAIKKRAAMRELKRLEKQKVELTAESVRLTAERTRLNTANVGLDSPKMKNIKTSQLKNLGERRKLKSKIEQLTKEIAKLS